MNKTRFVLLFFLFFSIFTPSFTQSLDIPPENVGGKAELKRTLASSFCGSHIDKDNRRNGQIILTFIVNKDGSTDSLGFVKGINLQVDKEVERIFPIIQWLPGKIDSNFVDAWHLIEFRLNDKFYESNDNCLSEELTDLFTYKECEMKPIFKGGDFGKWIYERLEYPHNALKNGIEGTVIVRFVIEKNGALSNVGIHKSVGSGCDEEAREIVLNSKWFPGKIDNQEVRTQIFYPVTFLINNNGLVPFEGGDMLGR